MIPGNVRRIQDWHSPKTVAELNLLLGFFGYYRSFIRRFSEMTCDMNDQKKLKKLSWSEEMEKELRALKQEFKDAPIRAVPVFDIDEPFKLTTDFSMKAMSAILSQVQDGHERLIVAMGHKMTDAEPPYPSWKGEASAVIYGSFTISCPTRSSGSTQTHRRSSR
ncbi:MAG: hypothetical protein GY696_07945 [Gammaproteobacteria bacterium]|nr:hypothetical protein [Gammaproteobacteria bacterium]